MDCFSVLLPGLQNMLLSALIYWVFLLIVARILEFKNANLAALVVIVASTATLFMLSEAYPRNL